MADQASVSNGKRFGFVPSPEGVVGGLTDFVGDLSTLAELQLRLARLDARDVVGRAIVPTGILAVGLALALSALPVGLLGVAYALHERLGWSLPSSLLLTALGALVLGGALAAFGGLKLPGCFRSFRRTSEELARNVAWLKTVIVYSGRSSATARRR